MAIERCAIRNMVNHKTYELFFDNLDVPVENLVGEEAKGFRYVLDGRNAERTLISAECIGDGSSFIDKVSTYTRERIVFDRPIGQNQRVRFSIARLWPIHERNEKGRLIRQRPFQVTRRCGRQKRGPTTGVGPKKTVPTWSGYTPIGICSADRVTARGAVSSFQVDKALLTAGNGLRLISFPRPGCGCEFCPYDQTTSPRDSV